MMKMKMIILLFNRAIISGFELFFSLIFSWRENEMTSTKKYQIMEILPAQMSFKPNKERPQSTIAHQQNGQQFNRYWKSDKIHSMRLEKMWWNEMAAEMDVDRRGQCIRCAVGQSYQRKNDVFELAELANFGHNAEPLYRVYKSWN